MGIDFPRDVVHRNGVPLDAGSFGFEKKGGCRRCAAQIELNLLPLSYACSGQGDANRAFVAIPTHFYLNGKLIPQSGHIVVEQLIDSDVFSEGRVAKSNKMNRCAEFGAHHFGVFSAVEPPISRHNDCADGPTCPLPLNEF